ncbi:MAG: hypothetical protein JW750_05690 [Anaerolineaceae bacterium]|nr:hypothetical protein [Anaerolineaceae bacterium]
MELNEEDDRAAVILFLCGGRCDQFVLIPTHIARRAMISGRGGMHGELTLMSRKPDG